jgi:2-keto-4-pentenoate hydratase/2-oxohepta-3-ene-1,7-dioic acid hydratase in catechol pathway
VTTLDEAGYPPALEMVLSVNSVEKQRVRTDQMIFDVPTVVSTVSEAIELQVGDVFATGTPSGVGFARQPPESLQVDDVIEASIEGLGSQRNLVVAAERSDAVTDNAGAG